MPFINTIGFENYRIFRNYSEFNFSPITLLTGANNSGKSSIFKALLLLQNSANKYSFLNNITFKGSNHFLGYFENVLNQTDCPLNFCLPFTFLNQNNFVIHLQYKKAENKQKNYFAKLTDIKIEYKQDKSTLFSIKHFCF